MKPSKASARLSLPPWMPALRRSLRRGYDVGALRADVLAGVTVGIIAVPLSLALAIATGVPPQHGLYTAIIAGLVIALTGGSKFNVSGPTAAFIVILQPIVQQYGLGGLLLAGTMAGIILIGLGLARVGQWISYIPYPVTTGFTAGIAVVIASLQLSDFLGLQGLAGSGHFAERMLTIVHALPSLDPRECTVGGITLAVLLLWRRLRWPLPPFLVAAVLSGLLAAVMEWQGLDVVTIADRFHYTKADGSIGSGIPPLPPLPVAPWTLPGADGQPLPLSLELLRALIPAAFAIALLGAIESLLCAVIADGMTGKRHDPDAELVGQGLGNLLVPFFAGIPATGALARTAASVRAGARSPLAAASHALFVLLAVLVLAPLLSRLPMAGLAAMLLMVAWNMSEQHRFRHLLKVAPRADAALMLLCFGLTVFFDMVLAIGVGVVAAALMFMHRMAQLAQVRLVDPGETDAPVGLPRDVRYYRLAGPLFFGAAEQAMSVLRRLEGSVRAVIIDLTAVPSIDATGLVALEELVDELLRQHTIVALCGAQPAVLTVLRDAGYRRIEGQRRYFRSVDAAVRRLQRPFPQTEPTP